MLSLFFFIQNTHATTTILTTTNNNIDNDNENNNNNNTNTIMYIWLGADVIARRSLGANEHGICHRRGLTVQPVTPIPDLRSDLDQPPIGSPSNRPPFQGFNFLLQFL